MAEEPSFRSMIEEKLAGFKQVTISGTIPHDDAIVSIRNSDYLIIPSRKDMFPTVAVEAMSLYRPCVLTSACGVTAYLHDEENALICRPGEAAALANRIHFAVQLLLSENDHYRELALSAAEVYKREFHPAVFRKRLYKWLSLDENS